MRPILLLLHLAGVIVWVGGMFFAHFCLRPVAAVQLQPPQRLPLLAAVLGRFFVAVAVAIAAIVGSGFALIAMADLAHLPPHWHLMMFAGLVMTAIFGVIYFRHYPRLKAGIANQEWPSAGKSMNSIRILVATNLTLGAATVLIATLGAFFG
jgi:uncharacterized membrane protein